MEVVGEVDGLKVYSDGSLQCHESPTLPASSHFTDGVASKDVVINPETGVWARIFRPETPAQNLPLLIYFHGGAFLCGSTKDEKTVNFLCMLCKNASVMIVSVDYRLAPEYRLPAAYDDCTEAVKWTAKSPDEWLSPAVVDLKRCFLGGVSAGANIVHNVGLRVAGVDMSPLVVKGMICIHPFFGGEKKLSNERIMFFKACKAIWSKVLPLDNTKGMDHPFCNPTVSTLKPELKLPPVLVALAGKDELQWRGEMFYNYLKKSGKEVEWTMKENATHVDYICHIPAITDFIKRHSFTCHDVKLSIVW
ncbi:hypothetical protein SUGI_0999010 [Cryptomeria japonica]|uniref:probable carboxylesterase 17 n=1 Tax=Cryptomeria japonica TaxID=3369 RepID=UPI002414C3A4|nr:probable carboxylesterase 17 [Cryptomeria japonica]GLJ47311.1 hypothetical protein SUGI_0999010 [Cryptomeria japonica]